MASSRSGQILDTVVEIGGGAAAGFLDAKFPDRKILGQPVGVVAAIAGVAAGLAHVGGKFGKIAFELGKGAAAFEVGKMVSNRVAGTAGVRGVGRSASRFGAPGRVAGLPAAPVYQQPITQSELARQMAAIR